MGVLEGVLCPFGHGVHNMPPCFDILRMRGIINEKSKKLIKILVISYTKMMSQVFLVKSEKNIFMLSNVILIILVKEGWSVGRYLRVVASHVSLQQLSTNMCSCLYH